MARLKNEKMRDSILLSAENLFSEHGYMGTTMSQIAKKAGTATSNVYVYYPSKIEIAFAVFDPWLRQRISGLRDDVADQTTPSQKLECLVNGLFNGIAADETGRTLTLMQALAMAKKTDDYSPELLNWTETQILKMVQGVLTDGNPQTLASAAHVLVLCFDSVALRQTLHLDANAYAQTAQAFLTLLLELNAV